MGQPRSTRPHLTSKTPGKDASITVRAFRETDAEEVRKLFVVCNTKEGSPLERVLAANHTERPSIIAYALILFGLYHLVVPFAPRLLNSHIAPAPIEAWRVFAGFLSIVVALSLIFGVRAFTIKMMNGFVQTAFETDLKDVIGTYGEGNFLVAEEDDGEKKAIVGFVGMDSNSKFARADASGSAAELRRMGVSPYYRRRGIAAMLLEAIVARARELSQQQPNGTKLTRLVLSTSDFQAAAIKLYEKHGWVKIRTREQSPLGIFHSPVRVHHLAFELGSE